MELRVLNYFLAVAREENFTKAAKQLHVTQPTLSRQIAQLEEELGVKLFQRSNHNIILTEDGMMLKRRAQEILTLADRTKRDFLRKEANLEGTIAIGSGEFLSTRILTDCMAAFRTQHPLVRYELYSGHGGSVRERLDRGLLDVGLMAEPVDIRKYEFIPMPIRERWCGRILRWRGGRTSRRRIWWGCHWSPPPATSPRATSALGWGRRWSGWRSSARATCSTTKRCWRGAVRGRSSPSSWTATMTA